MTASKIQLTEFHIEKLKNVVNVGRSSAYQILTTPGTVLGQIGPIAEAKLRHSANAACINPAPAAFFGVQNRNSWIRKTLSALRLR